MSQFPSPIRRPAMSAEPVSSPSVLPIRIGRIVAVAAALVLAAAAAGRADDAVILADGDRERGSIVSLAPDAVELDVRGEIKKFSIAEVREVMLDGEPEGLASARGLLVRRDGPGALEELTKIEAADLEGAEPRIREELAFVKAAATAQAATAENAAAAVQGLTAFLTRNARSHHFFEGYEILGDLHARLGKYAEAAAAYGELDRDDSLRVGVVFAHGHHFTGGLDLGALEGRGRELGGVEEVGALEVCVELRHAGVDVRRAARRRRHAHRHQRQRRLRAARLPVG